jgi:hypothetical protein
VVSHHDQIRFRLDRIQCIVDHDPAFALRQHRQIVLCVTDCHDVVMGNLHLFQGGGQAAAFVNPGGPNYYSVFVKGDLSVQPKVPYNFENSVFVRPPRSHYRFPHSHVVYVSRA